MRRLTAAAGVAAALMGWGAAGANAQVTRSFVATENPLWTLGGNWSPFGVPGPLDRARFGLGGGERVMQLPEGADASVRVITVAPLLGLTARYRFDLGEGTLRATSTNLPGLVVGMGPGSTLSTLNIRRGDLRTGLAMVGVQGPGQMWVESGEAGFARFFSEELYVGGTFPATFGINGRAEVNTGLLSGDLIFANGRMTVADGGELDVDGTLYVGLDRLGRTRPAEFGVQEFSFATVGSMRIGALAEVSTQVLVLDPELRGLTPALGVVGDFDLSASAGLWIDDEFIQREGATLKISGFAGTSPFQPIEGGAQLDGTFILTFASGFDPVLGSEFPLLRAADGVIGRWTVSYLPGLTGGRFLTIDYPSRAGELPTVILGVDELDQILDYDDPEDGLEIPTGPTAAVMGDFNDDGKPDVAIAFADPDEPLTAPGSVAILLNQGVDETGWLGFASQITLSVIADPRAVDVADFDLDGNLDVIVVGYTPQAAQVALNHGTSWEVRPAIALSSGPVDVKTADFNNDGRPDAVVALPDTESVQRLTNELRAFDMIPQIPEVVGLVVGTVDPFDPDADKDSDVGGAGGASGRGIAGQAFVLPNTGEGFGESAITDVGEAPVDMATGDLDGDGFPEVVTVDFGSNTVSVLVNDGQGGFDQAFSLPVGGEPRSITAADLDGDADLDIAIVAESILGRVIQVLRNDTQSVGDLVFAPISELGAGPDPSIVLSADLNSDERVDLLAINPSGPRGVDGGQVTVLLSKSTPRCAADFTRNGIVNQADLTAFLAAWFRDLQQGSFVADFNRDSVVNSTDVSDFVNAYLNSPAGCLG